MRKLLIITLFASAQLVQAQFTELGVFGGGTNFIGDVGQSGFSVPQGWVAGISMRHQFNAHYGVRAFGNLGTLAASDALTNIDYKLERNLSFRSSIWEVGLMLEINFFEYATGSNKKNHSPYIFGGISLFGFNPEGQYVDGNWYELQPLGTEGQGTAQNRTAPYSLSGLAIPFGIGYRASIGNNTSIAFEVGFRTTSTDYLDDAGGYYADKTALAATSGEIAAYFADRSLSDTDKTDLPRASAQYNDWYVFTGIHLYFAITPKNERCKRF